MLIRRLALLAVLLAGGVGAAGQQPKETAGSPYEKLGNYDELMARARRRKELLDSPNTFSFTVEPLRARPATPPSDGPPYRYRAGSQIIFDLTAKNNTTEPLSVSQLRPLTRFRPELFKGGELVPYRRAVRETIERIEQTPVSIELSGRYRSIEPGAAQVVGEVELKDWYEPLTPGEYRLKGKHRLYEGGQWLELPEVSFRVVP